MARILQCWKDPWLRTDGSSYVSSAIVQGMKNLKVLGRDGNWTQAQWAPAKNTHDGRVNARIVGYGHGYG